MNLSISCLKVYYSLDVYVTFIAFASHVEIFNESVGARNGSHSGCCSASKARYGR